MLRKQMKDSKELQRTVEAHGGNIPVQGKLTGDAHCGRTNNPTSLSQYICFSPYF